MDAAATAREHAETHEDAVDPGDVTGIDGVGHRAAVRGKVVQKT